MFAISDLNACPAVVSQVHIPDHVCFETDHGELTPKRCPSHTASGKSTIGVALEAALLQLGHRAFRLDGDNIRFGLNKDLGFSEKDRNENIRRIGEVGVDGGRLEQRFPNLWG